MARNDVDDGDRWWVRFGRERKDHRAACRRLLAAYRRQVLCKQRWSGVGRCGRSAGGSLAGRARAGALPGASLSQRRQSQLLRRSEEHTSELQSRLHLVCRLLLEKKIVVWRKNWTWREPSSLLIEPPHLPPR